MNQDRELLAWAASKLTDAQAKKLYGTVTITFEDGKITHSQTVQHDKPNKQVKA